jgi:polygalacturonase
MHMPRAIFTKVFAAAAIAAMMCLRFVQAAELKGVSIQVPAIPQRDFAITDFGAIGDGKTMNTAAFRAACEACAKAGGGRVIVPEGAFLSGPFELRSGMDLHLAKGAIIKMSPIIEDYPVIHRERQGFISAIDAQDVQISGAGTIDGQGEPWWSAFLKIKGTEALKTEPRRPQMIAFTRCERVKLEGFTTTRPPNTHCSLRQCKDVMVDGLTMLAPDESPNTDALNLNVRNAIVRNCNIATGDDNIVFLASTPTKEGTPGVENVIVSDCKLGVGHGLSLGSYTSGGIRNVTVENVVFDGTTAGIRLKAARDRGGLVENISFKNVVMKNVKRPVYLTSYYPKEPKHPGNDKAEAIGRKTPLWRNISIENVTITDCPNSITIWGVPEQPITGVSLRNLNVAADRGAAIYHAKAIRFENVEMRVRKGPVLTTFGADVEGLPAEPLATAIAQP